MKKDYIRFHDTGYFSKLMFDFLDENQEIQVFYNRYPKIENFKSQIELNNIPLQANILYASL